jgi:hypothetical protein
MNRRDVLSELLNKIFLHKRGEQGLDDNWVIKLIVEEIEQIDREEEESRLNDLFKSWENDWYEGDDD